MIKNKKLFVHFGGSYAGPAPKEFLNYDSSPTLIFERIPFIGRLYKKNKEFFPLNVMYGDIVKGLPLEENSVEGIYCSHVLEHLALNELKISLKNVYKLLRKEGIFRAVLPDMKSHSIKYSKGEITSIEFLKSTGLGTLNRNKSFKEMLTNHFGGSRHLWMWDFNSMKKELLECGFVDVREAVFNDSLIKEFKLVETEGRWKNEPVIGFEAVK